MQNEVEPGFAFRRVSIKFQLANSIVICYPLLDGPIRIATLPYNAALRGPGYQRPALSKKLGLYTWREKIGQAKLVLEGKGRSMEEDNGRVQGRRQGRRQ